MTTALELAVNRRILITDDNPAIHEDFRKVLAAAESPQVLDTLESSLFGETSAAPKDPGFDLTSAHQGQEAVDRCREALEAGRPFAVAFLDIRMPPGIDGVETALKLWDVDPRLQVVICSAYSDYSWEDMRQKLGARQQMLILKKPFDPVEVLQLAHALTEKWALLLASRRTLKELEAAVASRTLSLETTHRQLLDEIARREEVEARLHHSQRLEALGRLAGGIAHEINNPLAFITSNLHFICDVVAELETPIPGSADLAQATQDAITGAERIRRIVRDVKIFSQAEAAPISEVPLAAAVRRSIERATPELKGRASVQVDLGGVGAVMGSEEGLVQVLYNLVANAARALPGGAESTNRLTVAASLAPDGRTVIEVKDNGAGISPEHLPRVFDPFFTTRDVGSGTGLGLCICHGIITKLGGEISVTSVLGSGSVFRVVLPSATACRVATAA